MIRGWGLILEKQEELGSQRVVKLKLRGDRELGLGCGAGGWTGGEDPEGLGFVGGVVRDLGRAGELRGEGREWRCEGLRKVWEEKGGRWVEVRTWGIRTRRRWGSSSWVIAEWPEGPGGRPGRGGKVACTSRPL